MSTSLREFLDRARRPIERPADDVGWGLPAMRGRLVELSARGAVATLTAAIELVLEAQRDGEPVAWIMGPQGSFYPPDVAESGVDLAALIVVRVPDLALSARVAERLVRSGAFGLIVMDLGGHGAPIELPVAHQGRLITLAQSHDTAILCITEKSAESPSLGSLVSLRTEALRIRRPDGFELTLRVLKDKRRGPGWTGRRRLKGPSGL